MRVSFSTLACPGLDDAANYRDGCTAKRYDGIELRFVQGEDSLWKLPVFSGTELASPIGHWRITG